MDAVNAKSRVLSPPRWAGHIFARVIHSPRFALVLLSTIVLLEFSALLLKAGRKTFWYDELVTYHLSGLYPISLMWSALQAGADGIPLGYYTLVHFMRSLPGDPHITLRLPSIIGYLLTLLGVYWFARRALSGYAGLAAMLLIALSPFREYAVEARPYALLVGFLAMAAVLWQRIDEKRFMAPLLALFLGLAVASHYLAIVAVSPFGLAELTWTLLSRRIRWGVWAACLVATTPFFLGLPTILHFRAVFGKNFWAQPSWSMVISTYTDYLGLSPRLVLVLIVFFGISVGALFLRLIRRRGQGSPADNHLVPADIALIGGFFYFPALLIALTKLMHSGFTPRYGWPAIVGLALGSAYLFRMLWDRFSSIYLVGAMLVAYAVQGGRDIQLFSEASSNRLGEKRWTRLAEFSRDELAVPVIIGSGQTYLEVAKYAPPDLRERLIYVVDTDAAIRLAGSDTVDRTNRILTQFLPLHVQDLAEFETVHPRFLLLSGGGMDWITKYLLERRYNLRLLSKDGDFQVFRVGE